jgi:D-glycero-alpha-D-manno-heptose-7-phosphate kinase
VLVGADANVVIEIAAAQGALGWKVNGAGGNGGSVTVLTATRHTKTEFEHSVVASNARYRLLPIQISSDGLQVRGTLSGGET